jgi:ATP-dependent RNA helicase RhlE
VPQAAGSSPLAPGLPAHFSELEGVEPRVAAALGALGFHRPTEVQARAWPLAHRGQSVLLTAPTGTGKTLAYLLPVLQQLKAEDQPDLLQLRPRAIVLLPNRELAEQAAALAKAAGEGPAISLPLPRMWAPAVLTRRPCPRVRRAQPTS